MANIKDFIKKIGNSAVSLEEQQQALAQVEQTIIEAKQKRTEAIGKNAEMVVQALKTIEAKLEAKLEELNNTPAKQGIQGPAGKPGKDGKDGLNGRDGVNGKDGKDGKDGVDGNDGISVVDAKIDFDGSLVIYLSNGSEIDAGQILSPDVAQNIIINSGGSGTSQTVTDTLVSLQNQINTLTGIDGVLGDMAQQNSNNVSITGGSITGVSGLGTVTSVGGTGTVSGISLSGTVTSSGNLTLGGSLDLSAPPAIGGTTANSGRFTSVTNTGLTSGRVPYSTTNGLQTDSANLTFNGTTLTVNDFTDSSLTSGRVVYAGTGGNLVNSANLTFDGTTLTANTIGSTRINPRVSTTTSSATPTINTDTTDIFGLTAQTVDITSFTTNLSGTPVNGQRLWIYIVGTAARAITWGASFEASTVPLPTTTVSTNRLDVGFVWNAATSKWRCVASA